MDLVDGSGLGLSKPVLELGKSLFDGIEVGAVGRQEEEPGAGGADRLAHGLAFVAAEIVEDDDVTGWEGRNQELLDLGQELLAVDWAPEETRCIDPVMTQGGEEGERAPTAMRRLADQPVAARTPAAQGGHVGLGPGLVDKNQTPGIDARLAGLPLQAAPGDIRAVLLSRERSFF